MSVVPRSLAGRWARWVAFVGQRETGECLALFRIISGLALLISIGVPAINGLVDGFWVDLAYGGMRPLKPGWLVAALGGATPATAWILVLSTLTAGVGLVLGVGGRVVALIAGQGLMALSGLNTHTRGSFDALLINSLWLLVLAEPTVTLSLPCRYKTGKWTSHQLVAAWPRYLIIAQIGVLYFFTGLHKVSIYWTPAGGFSALYYILQQPSWQFTSMHWLARVYPLTQLATVLAWLFELTWPLMWLALYYRRHPERSGRLRGFFNRFRVRSIYAVVGLSMHVGIAMVMDVGPFTLVTLAFYPSLLRPSEVRLAARGVGAWLTRRRSGSSTN
ncbi:MAG: hypothetical protein JKY37_11080 [Nannocystaceae bacterium]|nr:hypothetical protein [Nannocystaceae bacterium]